MLGSIPASAKPIRQRPGWFASLIFGMLRTGGGRCGCAIMVLLCLIALLAPVLTLRDPGQIVGSSLLPPSSGHWFGTDDIGRDMLALVCHGTRASLVVGLSAAFLALCLGGTIGAVAGYFRGPTEIVLMRLVELFQTMPVIITVLFVVALFGSHFWLLTGAVAMAIWPLEARIVYGQFVSLRARGFVQAAQVAGMPALTIILAEIIPNALPPIVGQVALDAGHAILIEAGLGFLGLADPAVPSWGQLLYAAQAHLEAAWWMSVFPGAAICMAVLGLNLLADGINQVITPQTAVRRRL
jgi:peptide/nickel transport system permease protein